MSLRHVFAYTVLRRDGSAFMSTVWAESATEAVHAVCRLDPEVRSISIIEVGSGCVLLRKVWT